MPMRGRCSVELPLWGSGRVPTPTTEMCENARKRFPTSRNAGFRNSGTAVSILPDWRFPAARFIRKERFPFHWNDDFQFAGFMISSCPDRRCPPPGIPSLPPAGPSSMLILHFTLTFLCGACRRRALFLCSFYAYSVPSAIKVAGSIHRQPLRTLCSYMSA